MGCYNSSGFISKLPIKCGDRVVCFIALQNGLVGRELYDPDILVTPFFLPIRGEYNDYGSVENIDRTVIVKLLEKYSGNNIEKILNGIERCLYGNTLQENIEYWERAKMEMIETCKKSGSDVKEWTKSYDEDLERYAAVVPLFADGRSERTQKELEEFLKKYPDIEAPKFPARDVSPVLLMEHEDVYDKFTQEFAKPDYMSSIFGTPEGRFNNFMKSVKALYEKREKMERKNNVIPSPSGHYHNFELYEIFNDDERKEIENSIPLIRGQESNSLEFFDKLTDDERLEVYATDELRRFYNLWYKFAVMPMYFTFSQTAGMQEYRYDIIKELYDVCYEKMESEKAKEEEDEDYGA